MTATSTLAHLGRIAEDDTAALLGITVRRLRENRWRGVGPAYAKAGRTITYRAADVEAWIESHRVDPEALA